MNMLTYLIFSLLFSFLLCKFDTYELSKKDLIFISFLNIVFSIIFYYKVFDILSILCLITIFSILNIVFMIDFRFKEIPNIYVVLITVFSFTFYMSNLGLYEVSYSTLIRDGLMYVIIFMGLMVVSGGALGAGDVKLAFPLGVLLTKTHYLDYIGYTFLFGAIVAIGLVITKKYNRKDKIAFGPFMILTFYYIFINIVL